MTSKEELTIEQLEYYINTYERYDGIESNIFEQICNELIDFKKSKTHPLSECIKEWKKRGWTVSEKSDFHNGWDYRRYFVSKNEYKLYQPRIVFIKYDKTYYAYEGFDTTDFEGYPKTEIRPLNISEELNDLIRKTLKALEEKE